ncbi:MAG TPA: helicase-related protein, partial [Vulgatibacter sp.]
MVYSALAQTGVAKRVLVVAPAHLTVQWLAELYHKFHSMFTLLDAERLDREEELDPTPAWWRFPKVVTSLELLESSKAHRDAIGDPAGRWDLVIIDEAHHLTSPKAYDAAESLADNSHGLLLLTATPLQLDPVEHFKLLTLVDPATPESYEDFEARLERQGDLSQKIRELLEAKDAKKAGRAAKAIAAILPEDDVLEEGWEAIAAGEEGAREPFVAHVAEAYSISSRLIRNRRAIVGGLAPRRLVRHDVKQSAQEKALRMGVAARLASGELKATGLALVSLLKRLDSSPRAAAAALARHGHEDLAKEARALEGPTRDAKARALLEVVRQVREDEPGAKLLVFAEARETLDYVRDVLARNGVAACVYHGDLPQLDRDRQVARFRDPEGPSVMVCAEVGGEGRNFQFCHHLVNYDLAWSPAAIEQRIGRLDRIGQNHEVRIHCFRVEGTNGARVFDLMADAVRVFEETVGGLDPVLEQVEADIAKIASVEGDPEVFARY